MKPPALALAIALTAGAAHAALAPQYYQQARDQAPNVVVLEITGVTPPARDHGDCKVAAKAHQVERGDLYRNGQAFTLIVPCMTPRAQIPAGPVVWQRREDLKTGVKARAWMDGGGNLALYQFQLLH